MVVLVLLGLCSVFSLAVILERLVFFITHKKFTARAAEQHLYLLSTCISVAPLLGILGTVIGIMQAFGGYSLQGDLQSIAGGIALALRTTAAGLLIALTDLVFYNYFSFKADGAR
ncbi:proton channel ExbB [Candidatus Termititenax persephonae]|uniref:Proton channel ExbB n=1 Tax=Candidatus Termititenax persephonae TaxID=2218525 RepID=A0A388TFJ4_9BACT|nr:proton channel ExbB [Candidatus Termititenax persephonae]